MQTTKSLDPLLKAIMQLLTVVSVIGFFVCALIIMVGVQGIAMSGLMLYLLWFALSVLALSMMQQGDQWGAYALAIATLGITFYDLFNHTGTVGGALSGLLILSVIWAYLRATPPLTNSTS